MNSSSVLQHLREKQPLSTKQVEWLAEFLLLADGPDSEKADLLRALTNKGESVEEIVGFVRVFLRHAIRPDLDLDFMGPAIDVCGTGGDRLDLFNVSTTSMFILAAGGATVVKHGNRGITSKSGGADVLEALGIRIDLPPEEFAACVEQTGLGFMFAPNFHPAFKAVAGVRKQLAAEGLRTVFNILGPLLNPVQPLFQLVGVADPNLPKKYVEILYQLGRQRAWAVHGSAGNNLGMDELSTLGPTKICEVDCGRMREMILQPADLGLAPARLDELRGGDAAENARILRGIVSGEIKGPKRDLVLLNSGAGFLVTGQASTWAEGLGLAGSLIENGSALAALEAVRSFCQSLGDMSGTI